MHRISISLVRGGVSMLRRMILLCRNEREGGLKMKVEGGGEMCKIELIGEELRIEAKWTPSRQLT